MGIEPTYSAWEADALPLSYTRDSGDEYSPSSRFRSSLPPRPPAPGRPARYEPPAAAAFSDRAASACS
jgi:hypothetical protein